MQCPKCKSHFKTKFLPKFVKMIVDIWYQCVNCPNPKCDMVIIVKKVPAPETNPSQTA